MNVIIVLILQGDDGLHGTVGLRGLPGYPGEKVNLGSSQS